MSDYAEQYYNAWSGVFGAHDTKRLYVDRAWRTTLNQYIPNRQEIIEVLSSALHFVSRARRK